jgi:hypothetical protein
VGEIATTTTTIEKVGEPASKYYDKMKKKTITTGLSIFVRLQGVFTGKWR